MEPFLFFTASIVYLMGLEQAFHFKKIKEKKRKRKGSAETFASLRLSSSFLPHLKKKKKNAPYHEFTIKALASKEK